MVSQRVKGYDEKTYGITAEYGYLGDGQTASGQVCPACEGGSTKERSFSVSRRGGVLVWNCHRASCGFRGGDGQAPQGTSGGSTGRTSSNAYVPTTELSAATIRFLAAKFGIPRESFALAGLRWTGDGHGYAGRRICYPIFSPDSRKRGENYRSYEGAKPKAIIKLEEGEIAASWYKWRRKSDTLIIVEDQVSAIKIAPYHDSLALLGTGISEAKAAEIAAGGYKHVCLCLDNDATYQAIKLQIEWRSRIPNLCVKGLEKDVKNMSREEFEEFLKWF